METQAKSILIEFTAAKIEEINKLLAQGYDIDGPTLITPAGEVYLLLADFSDTSSE